MTNYYRVMAQHIISFHFKRWHVYPNDRDLFFAAICVDFIHVFNDELSLSLLRGCVQHLAGFHPAQTSPSYANPSPYFTLLSLGATKNVDLLNNVLWSESCALWLKIFDIGLKVPSFLLFSNFHCLLQAQSNGVIRKAGFWNNRKKRGFWNSWRKCPNGVVLV